ncbi:MAG TPA: 1-acyl-sn-glycerol-3-phosphate acyltransferase [Bacteroidales bacterium]|nr:1-acyl-sn-glycerol-3-phosphate acyltransferase [Bacteroidales bacterium]
MIEDFPEHLRPYTDKEIPGAMQRIAAHRFFPLVAGIIFPGITPEEARDKILKIKTVFQFQMEWMYAFNERVISTTMEQFTYDFSPEVKRDRGYLYISNHRDIILDSSLLQMVFVYNNLPTSMITYGDNLLINQLAEDIARSNKMFKVVRKGNKRALFKNSTLLSEFIRSSVREGNSCWIAQRNGRTKDGIDKTSQALVKMMAMSGSRKNPVDNYAALNIVPVTMSYEYEPCDYLKTRELLALSGSDIYEKEEGEDLNSMLTGVTQYKGRVHIHVGDPITREQLEPYSGEDFAAFSARVCDLIDNQITGNYQYFPSNYVAYDLLHGTTRFSDHYTPEYRSAFIKRMEKLFLESGSDIPFAEYLPKTGIYTDTLSPEELQKAREIFLGIYAHSLEAQPLEAQPLEAQPL